MKCEASVPGRGRDVSGGHRCDREARWLIHVDPRFEPGQTVRFCAQHRKQLERFNTNATAEEIS